MESLHLNLSEEEFSKSRKNLLWGFSTLFLLATAYVLITNLVFGHKSIPLFISLITFGISLFVGLLAAFDSITRKDLFFIVDDERIEFKFGIINPRKHVFKWIDIKELIMPQKQKKILLLFNDGSSFLINLNWLQRQKSSRIRKHIYQEAREKNLKVTKVSTLKTKIQSSSSPG